MNILKRIHNKMAWEGYFFAFVLWILFMHSGSDHMVTGIINPGVPTDQFRAYVAWESGLNLGYAGIAAMLAYLLGVKKYSATLVFFQLMWVWFGGALDILWFMIHGSMPTLKTIMWWIFPWWTWWMHIVYASCWILGLVIGWILHYRR